MLQIQRELRALNNPEKTKILSGFFKCGQGQYGEWDIFLGINVPDTRKIVWKYAWSSTLDDVVVLLRSEYHEERLTGVLLLVHFAKKKTYTIEELAEFYMHHSDRVNNWDLVDVSSEHIIGPHLETLSDEARTKFIESAITSEHLWTNRIIILASFYFIKRGSKDMIVSIAPRFLSHPHDLIHKAVGWMLREMGKRVSETELCLFLDQHASRMPRTMLRYAIERLPEDKKKKYMLIKKI